MDHDDELYNDRRSSIPRMVEVYSDEEQQEQEEEDHHHRPSDQMGLGNNSGAMHPNNDLTVNPHSRSSIGTDLQSERHKVTRSGMVPPQHQPQQQQQQQQQHLRRISQLSIGSDFAPHGDRDHAMTLEYEDFQPSQYYTTLTGESSSEEEDHRPRHQQQSPPKYGSTNDVDPKTHPRTTSRIGRGHESTTTTTTTPNATSSSSRRRSARSRSSEHYNPLTHGPSDPCSHGPHMATASWKGKAVPKKLSLSPIRSRSTEPQYTPPLWLEDVPLPSLRRKRAKSSDDTDTPLTTNTTTTTTTANTAMGFQRKASYQSSLTRRLQELKAHQATAVDVLQKSRQLLRRGRSSSPTLPSRTTKTTAAATRSNRISRYTKNSNQNKNDYEYYYYHGHAPISSSSSSTTSMTFGGVVSAATAAVTAAATTTTTSTTAAHGSMDRHMSLETRRSSSTDRSQQGRLNVTRASDLSLTASQRQMLHELGDDFLTESSHGTMEEPTSSSSFVRHNTAIGLSSQQLPYQQQQQEFQSSINQTTVKNDTTNDTKNSADREARMIRTRERKERLHRVKHKIKTVETLKSSILPMNDAAFSRSTTNTTSAAVSNVSPTITTGAVGGREDHTSSVNDQDELTFQSLLMSKQPSDNLLQPSMDDIQLETSFSILGGQLFSQNKHALTRKLSPQGLHETRNDNDGSLHLDSIPNFAVPNSSTGSTSRQSQQHQAHGSDDSERMTRQTSAIPSCTTPNSSLDQVTSILGTIDMNLLLDEQDEDDEFADNRELSRRSSMRSLVTQNQEQNESESTDPSIPIENTVPSDVMSHSEFPGDGSTSLPRQTIPTLASTASYHAATIAPVEQRDQEPHVKQIAMGDPHPATAATRQSFQKPHPRRSSANFVDDANSSAASSSANEYLDDTSFNSANVDAMVEATWTKSNRRPTLLVIDEATGNASDVNSSGILSPEDLEQVNRAETIINPIEQKLVAQQMALYDDDHMGRRDSAFSHGSMSNSSTSRRQLLSRKSASRRISLVQPHGAVPRMSLTSDTSRRNFNQSFVASSVRAIDFSFGDGQTELANVRIDDTPPPNTTRRAMVRDRTTTSIANTVKDAATIESAAMAMAALYSEGNHRRSRDRGDRLSGSNQGSIGMKTRRNTKDSLLESEAFMDFKSNASSQDDEALDMKSAFSSDLGSMEFKKPSIRSLSLYHSKNYMPAEARQETNDRIWAAVLHGHGVMLKSSGERPVLKRLYGLCVAAACITISLLLPLVILPHFQASSGSDEQNSSFCRDPSVPYSVKRCPCNSTVRDIVDPTFRDNYKALEALLLDEGIVSAADLQNDSASCASKNVAIQWLAEDSWNFTTKENVSTIERYVLGLVFLELGGDRWYNNSGWMTELDLCDWKGLNCTRSGLAKHLGLSRNNLQGVIPSEISHLALLESIQLDQNSIGGELPSSISTMSNLVEINLSSNSMGGGVSSQIFQKSHTTLRHLNLASNRFHGSLSTSLGLLTRLEFIDLSFNEMSGSLPDELGQLSELATLMLADNDFTNQLPTTLVQLTRLQMLDIRNNAFVGTITDTICQDLVFLNEIRVDCSSTFATGNCTCCVCSDTGMNAT